MPCVKAVGSPTVLMTVIVACRAGSAASTTNGLMGPGACASSVYVLIAFANFAADSAGDVDGGSSHAVRPD